MQAKGFIFDLDGTLLDSMGLWEQIDKDFLANRGINIPSDYINAIANLSFFEAAEYTVKRFNLSDTPEELIIEWNAMAVNAYRYTIVLKPYAKEYLTKLKNTGVKLAIATALPPELYLPALERDQLHSFFDAVCSTSEIDRGKDFPDIYLLAAKKLQLEPKACIVFEDTLQGIKSAKQAGMRVYGVYDESSKHEWQQMQSAADGVLWDFENAPINQLI